MAATADRPDRIGYGRALAAGEFRALFVGQSISISGSSVAAVALAILVYRRTGSPFLSALTFALGFLPYVVGAGFLSGLVDRIRPRRLGVACDLTSGAIAVGMAWPGMPVAALLGMLAAMGLLGSLSGGARAALVRSTVAPAAFVPARSLLKLASQTAQIGGNAVGGLLVAAIGPSGAILVNAASFAFSAAIVRTFVGDHPNAGARGQGSVVSDSLRGARDILGRARLRRLLVFGWLVPTFTAAPEALAVPYVSARHGSAALVGVWLAAFPIGLIAGDIAGVRWLSPAQQRRFMVPAAVASFLPVPRLSRPTAGRGRPGPAARVGRGRHVHAGPGRPHARDGAGVAVPAHDGAQLGRADDAPRTRIRACGRGRPGRRLGNRHRGGRDLRPRRRGAPPRRGRHRSQARTRRDRSGVAMIA